jgi:hypothetical protein
MRNGLFARACTGVLVLCLTITVLGVVVFGDADDSVASSSPTPPLTPDQLTGALLTLTDLPASQGFMAVPGAQGELPPDSETGGVCNGPTVTAVATQAGSSAGAAVNFLNSNSDGPYVSELALSFPSESAAKQFVKLFREQVTSCTSGWSDAPLDPPTTYMIKAVPFAKVGDQRFASHTDRTGGGDDITRDPDLPGVIEEAMVRVGSNVILVSRYGISVVMNDVKPELRANVKLAVAHLASATKTAKTGTAASSKPADT